LRQKKSKDSREGGRKCSALFKNEGELKIVKWELKTVKGELKIAKGELKEGMLAFF